MKLNLSGNFISSSTDNIRHSEENTAAYNHIRCFRGISRRLIYFSPVSSIPVYTVPGSVYSVITSLKLSFLWKNKIMHFCTKLFKYLDSIL